MKTTTPIDSIINWYKGAPQGCKPDIALLISHFSGKLIDIPTSDKTLTEDPFITWIESHKTDEISSVGFVVALRAQIEFVLIRKRGSEASWSELSENNRRMKDQCIADGKPEMAQFIENMEAKFPQQKMEWLELCETWRTLRIAELSDDALEMWEDSILIKNAEKMNAPRVVTLK